MSRHDYDRHRSSNHKRSREQYESDEESHKPKSSSSTVIDYKEMYRDLREQYKAKKRRIEDLEEKLDHEKRETAKAKVDTQELWKIYYTLQKEVTDSYEKCSRLSAEKSKISKELDEAKGTAAVTGEASSLKQALLNMQKGKQDLQNKFNDIVIENKRLREKAVTYEPKIREMDSIRESIQNAATSTTVIREELEEHKKDLDESRLSKEELDNLRRWNSLLMMESEQKESKLRNLADSDANITLYQAEVNMLKGKIIERDTLLKKIRDNCERKLISFVEPLRNAGDSLRQLKMDWTWSGEAAKLDLNKVNNILKTFSNKLTEFQKKAYPEDTCAPSSSAIDSSDNIECDKQIPLLEQSSEVSQSLLDEEESNGVNNTAPPPPSMYLE